MAPGKAFSHRFEEYGEFPYYCSLHPNMVGKAVIMEGLPREDQILLEGVSSSEFTVQVRWIPNNISKQNNFGLKCLDAEGDEISEVSYSIMLFKEGKHLDETHREGQTAEQQVLIFDEKGRYIVRIENINGSGS